MARVQLDEAYVRISLDDKGLDRDARRAGARAGRAFARAAQRAAREIEVRWNLNEPKLRQLLRRVQQSVDVEVNFVATDQALQDALGGLNTQDAAVDVLVQLQDQQARDQLAALGAQPITIPANVAIDQAGAGAQIPVTPTFDPNDVQGLFKGIKEPELPAGVRVDPAELQRHLNSLPKPKLKVDADPSSIAAQIAAGIRAGEAAGGDIQIGSNFIINRALLRARLAALKPRIPVRLDVDKATLEKFKRITIPAKLDLDRAALEKIRPVTVPANLKVDDKAIRRLGKQITIPVRVRTDGNLPSQGPDLTALVHINGTALNGAVKSIEDHFRANPIKLVAQVQADDRAVEEVRRKTATKHLTLPVDVDVRDKELDALTEKLRKRTLEIDVNVDRGPNGTKLFDALDEKTRRVTLELDVREGPGGTRVEELLNQPDRTLHLTLDLNDEATRRLDQLATEEITVDVRAALDEATVRLARKDLERTLDLADATVEIRAEADEATVRAAVASIERVVDRADPTVDVGAEVTAAEVRAAVAAVEGTVRAAHPTIDINVDTDRAEVRAAVAGLERTVEGSHPSINARLDIDTAHFREQVARLSPVHIRAEMDVDRDRITRALGDAGRVGGEALSNGIGDAVNAGGSGGGLGGLTSSLGGIVGPLVQAGALASALAIAGAGIAAAFGAVATAVAALPGLIGLAGAAVGAIALGMDGIKAAAKALQPEFDALKKAVSDAFQTGLAPAFEQLRTVFPVLQTGLVGVAGGLSTVAKGFADAVTSGEGLSNLQAIFANVKTALVNMTPGIQLITGAFLKMASQSGVFDILTTTVNRFGSAFSSSVGRLLADGNTMQKAFQGLGDVLGSTAEGFVSLVENGIKLFSTAAPGVVSFLDQLTGFFNKFDYKALGGAVGSVFQGLGDAIGAIPKGVIDQIVQSFKELGAIFQQATIQTAIQQMAAAFPAVIQIIGSLTEVFFALGGVFATLAPGFAALFDGLAAGIAAAAPGLSALGTAISAIFVAVAPLLEPLGQIAGILAGALAQAVTALLPAFNALVPSLVQVATIFATTLAQAVATLAPVFAALAPVIAQVAQVVGEILVQAMTALAPLLPPLVQAFGNLIMAILPLIPPILQIAQAVIPLVISAFTAVLPVVTAVINVLALLISAVVSVVAPVLSFGAQVIGMFSTVSARIVGFVGTIISTVVNGFTNFTTTAVSTVSGMVNSVTSFFGNLGTQAKAKINEMINGIVTYFRGLPGQALGALSAFPGQMVALGGQVIQGLLNGLRNAGGAVIDYLTNLASQALQSAKSFLGIASPSRVFRDQIGEQIGAGLAIGIQRSTSGVVDAAEAMGQAAVDAVDVSGAGKAADKIIAQITGARGGDGSSLGDYIANTVTDALGNLTVKANAAGQQVEAVVNTTDRDRDLLDELRGLRGDVQGLEVHGGDTTIDIDVAASVAETADEINSRLRTQSALGVFQR